MSEITPDQLDRLGQIADKAENYLAAATLPAGPATHAIGLRCGMAEIRDEAQALYRELGGEE